MAKKTETPAATTTPAPKSDPATQTEIERLQAQLAAMRSTQPAAPATQAPAATPAPPPPAPAPTPTPAPEAAKAEQPAPAVRQVVIEDAGPPSVENPAAPEPVKATLTDKVREEMEAGRRKVAAHTKYAAAAEKVAKKGQ